MNTAANSQPLILLSTRLGEITSAELRLEAAGARIQSASLASDSELVENGSGAAVIIVGAVEPLGAAQLESLPRLQAIVRRGVGVDNVDVSAATALGIIVANVPD